jgi:hypothetical protein
MKVRQSASLRLPVRVNAPGHLIPSSKRLAVASGTCEHRWCQKSKHCEGSQMEWATRRSLDRVGLLTIVLSGHWLLIEVLDVGQLVEPHGVTVDSPESWIWNPVTPDIPREQHERIEKIDRRPRTQMARPVRTAPPTGANGAPMQPSEPAAENAPDWISEAQSVAESMAPRLINELQEKCATARRLARALPAGCKRESLAKDWQPEPKRAGFIGIFPYVRLGRCIIGLGFWGCAVQTPSADGTLFEDMRNPDRPASSVPDLPVQTFPAAPVPQAFK